MTDTARLRAVTSGQHTVTIDTRPGHEPVEVWRQGRRRDDLRLSGSLVTLRVLDAAGLTLTLFVDSVDAEQAARRACERVRSLRGSVHIAIERIALVAAVLVPEEVPCAA